MRKEKLKKQLDIPNIFGRVISDVAKYVDKKDLLKTVNNVLAEHDELLSCNSIGKVVKWLCTQAIAIDDIDEAFRQLIVTSYLIAVSEALDRVGVEQAVDFSSLSLTLRNAIQYCNAESFDIRCNGFLKNDVIDKCQSESKRYFTKLKPRQRAAFTEYIREQLEVIFYETLSKQYIVFKNYSEYISTNIYKLENRNSRVAQYKATLKNLYWNTIMQDETGLRLADIYIEPGFGVHRICFSEADKRYAAWRDFVDLEEESKDVHDYLGSVLQGKDSLNLKTGNSKLIFVLGYPGQGKTSLCKRLLHDIITKHVTWDKPVFYVPLRQIEATHLINAPLETIQQFLCKEVSIDVNALSIENALLVLDGLDEVYMHGAKATGIDEFCHKLAWQVREKTEMKVLVTSRHGYIDVAKLCNNNVLVLQIRELTEGQQNRWLSIYRKFHIDAKLTETMIGEIHKNYNYKHIKELIGQPILLYMVATANIAFDDSSFNRARIYRELFDTLVNRNWAGSNLPIETLLSVKAVDLRQLIRAVALAIFQKGEEYITRQEVLQLAAVKKFNMKVGDGNQFADSLKGMLIAFYFQETMQIESNRYSGEYTVEFLHKSLQEYMVAEEIWERIKEYGERRKNGDFFIDNLENALEQVTQLFAPRYLSREVNSYLCEIAINDTDTDKRLLFERMSSFLGGLQQRDFFAEKMNIEKSQFDAMLSTFYGYWVTLAALIPEDALAIRNGCDSTGKQDIEWNYISTGDMYRFLVWVKCLCASNSEISINLKLQLLQKAKLNRFDLCKADLRGTNLSEAELYMAYLIGANLSGANLCGANLGGANLCDADLSRVDLRLADLRMSFLSNANLRGANLCDADLSGADLRDANLSGANLSGVDLTEADLRGADLSRANLREAYLIKTDLRGANLCGADFYKADLGEANLIETNLREASLSGAYLRKIDLSEIDLRGINLSSVNWYDSAVQKKVAFIK